MRKMADEGLDKGTGDAFLTASAVRPSQRPLTMWRDLYHESGLLLEACQQA
jgi:hypothetical protein